MVVIWASFYSFGIFLQPVLSEFHWSRANISGAFSFCSITMGLIGIVMGGLNDRFGPRLVMSLCAILLGIGFCLMSRLGSIWHLYLFYGAILGIGMGGSFVPLMTTVARWFSRRRSLMTGVVSSGIGIGALVGLLLVNRFISSFGWRTSYLFMGGVVFGTLLLSAQFMRRDPFQIGLEIEGGADDNKEGRIQEAQGLSPGEAYRTRSFWVLFFMIFCLGFCVFSVMVHVAAHAMDLGLSSGMAARILGTIGGFSIVGKILIGRMADLVGNRKAFLLGFLLMAGALFWMPFATSSRMLYGFAVLFGIGYGGCVTSESPMVAHLFGLGSHGLILGIIAFGFTIGGAIGPWLTGYVFDITKSYQFAFLGCAIISSVGFVLTFFVSSKPVSSGHGQRKMRSMV